MNIFTYVALVVACYSQSCFAMKGLFQKQAGVAQEGMKGVQSNLTGIAEYKSYQFADKTITVAKGDITKFRVDAIVNAANAGLWRGGGVCGAIFNAAGKNYLERAVAQLKNLPPEKDRIGMAFVTPVPDTDEHNIATIKSTHGIKHVVHAVGPDCRDESDKKVWKEKLGNAYKNSLIEANKVGAQSIAFPAISTAIFACPMKDAVPVALGAIIETVQKIDVKHVVCVFLPNDKSGGYDMYTDYLDKQSTEQK